jgi:hypothetical protein
MVGVENHDRERSVPESALEADRSTFRRALAHMGFAAGQPIKGAKIDVAFVGS